MAVQGIGILSARILFQEALDLPTTAVIEVDLKLWTTGPSSSVSESLSPSKNVKEFELPFCHHLPSPSTKYRLIRSTWACQLCGLLLMKEAVTHVRLNSGTVLADLCLCCCKRQRQLSI